MHKKHGAIQNEVDNILGIIILSGIQKQDYGNKIRTGDLRINAQELISKVDLTLTLDLDMKKVDNDKPFEIFQCNAKTFKME